MGNDRICVLSSFLVHHAFQVICISRIGVSSNCLTGTFERFIEFALGLESIAKVTVGLSEVGIDGQGFLIAYDRIVEAAGPQNKVSQIIVRLGMPWVQ